MRHSIGEYTRFDILDFTPKKDIDHTYIHMVAVILTPGKRQHLPLPNTNQTFTSRRA